MQNYGDAFLKSSSISVSIGVSDQTARRHRLVSAFAGRTYHIVGNLILRFIISLFANILPTVCTLYEEKKNRPGPTQHRSLS